MSSAFNSNKFRRVAFAALVAFASFTLIGSSNALAKPKKAKYGTIKILTTPGGFPMSVDGKAYGATTTEFRSIDLEPGLHTVVIDLPGGQRWTREVDLPAGRIKCIALNYKSRPPLTNSPCPFPVNVSAPTQVNEGDIITYTSDVAYMGTSALKYSWIVKPSGARIVNGAGTPTITIDSTGLAGQDITATLTVNDGSGEPGCSQITRVSTNVRAVEKTVIVGREFDTCCSCSSDDLKARLDNLVVELQNDPTTTTHIFAYGGRTSQTGQADRLLTRAKDYLVSQRGIDNSRIILVNGGFREEDCVEVWIVPRGARPPQPTPTVQPGDVKQASAPATRRRRT